MRATVERILELMPKDTYEGTESLASTREGCCGKRGDGCCLPWRGLIDEIGGGYDVLHEHHDINYPAVIVRGYDDGTYVFRLTEEGTLDVEGINGFRAEEWMENRG